MPDRGSGGAGPDPGLADKTPERRLVLCPQRQLLFGTPTTQAMADERPLSQKRRTRSGEPKRAKEGGVRTRRSKSTWTSKTIVSKTCDCIIINAHHWTLVSTWNEAPSRRTAPARQAPPALTLPRSRAEQTIDKLEHKTSARNCSRAATATSSSLAWLRGRKLPPQPYRPGIFAPEPFASKSMKAIMRQDQSHLSSKPYEDLILARRELYIDSQRQKSIFLFLLTLSLWTCPQPRR